MGINFIWDASALILVNSPNKNGSIVTEYDKNTNKIQVKYKILVIANN